MNTLNHDVSAHICQYLTCFDKHALYANVAVAGTLGLLKWTYENRIILLGELYRDSDEWFHNTFKLSVYNGHVHVLEWIIDSGYDPRPREREFYHDYYRSPPHVRAWLDYRLPFDGFICFLCRMKTDYNSSSVCCDECILYEEDTDSLAVRRGGAMLMLADKEEKKRKASALLTNAKQQTKFRYWY